MVSLWREQRRIRKFHATPARLVAALGLLTALVLGVVALQQARGGHQDSGRHRRFGGKATTQNTNGIVELNSKVKGCHTAVRGETCHGDIMWAMENGITKNPGWYPGLSNKSTFEDFQRFMHSDRPRVCPEPCPREAEEETPEEDDDAVEAKEKTTPEPKDEKDEEEEDTVKKTTQAPEDEEDEVEEEPGEDEKEDDKAKTTSAARKETTTPAPEDENDTAKTKRTTQKTTPAPEKDTEKNDTKSSSLNTAKGFIDCHTALPDEECHKRVMWVKTDGLVDHPAWYKHLSKDSSFADIQVFVHNERPMVCPLPCDRKAIEAEQQRHHGDLVTKTDEDDDKDEEEEEKPSCHTAAHGEKCYDQVVWVTTIGLAQHPKWYKGLTKYSTFEEVQQRLHNDKDKKDNDCPQPCAKELDLNQGMPHYRPNISNVTTTTEKPTTTVTTKSPKELARAKAEAEAKAKAEAEKKAAQERQRAEQIKAKMKAKLEAMRRAKEELEKARAEAKEVEAATAKTSTTETSVTTTETSVTTTSTSTTVTVTTTTTTTPCHTVGSGKCHDAIIWVMKDGLFNHPKWYAGLTRASSYEVVQARLQKDPKAECPAPCECHTAVAGSKCHKEVLWVLTTGIKEHPHRYSGFSATSRFEEVQELLHKERNGTCPTRPCKAIPWGFPSLFCYSVVRPTGYEPDVLRKQLEKGGGIFACDEYAVYSDTHFKLGPGVETITFVPAKVGVSKDGTAGNALLFMHVWEAVKHDFRSRNLDWTVKVDPDAVILPGRLRTHLAPHNGESVYIKNCGAYSGPGWPMMFGALEVFSRKAITAYFEGDQKCKDELDWKPWGEDLYMMNCLEHLGVGSVADMSIVFDGVCKGWSNCGDQKAAAFHPFKSVDKWLACWEKATR